MAQKTSPKTSGWDTFKQGLYRLPADWAETVNPANIGKIAREAAVNLAKSAPPRPYLSTQDQESDEGIGLKEYNKRHPAMTPGVVQYYKDTYGSPGGFANAWKTHPLGPISDAAMLAELGGATATGFGELDPSIVAAREAAIATGKRAPFSLARTVAGTGKAVGVATSPMLAPMAALHVASPIINKVPTFTSKIVDTSGNLTPRAEAAINAATDGHIAPGDVQAAVPDIVQAMQRKGANPAAAREAIAKSQGVSLVRAQATRKRPPRYGIDAVEGAKQDGNAAIAARTSALAPPPPTSLGKAWETAQNASKANSDAAYDAIKTIPGEISDPSVADAIKSAISARIGGGTPFDAILDGGDGPGKNAALHVKALINNIAAGVPVSAERFSDTTKLINDQFRNASEPQREILFNLKNGLHDAIGSLRPDQFTGNAADLYASMAAARDAYAKHRQTFFGSHPTNGKIVNQAANDAGNAIENGNVSGADSALGKSLIDPKTGMKTPDSDATYAALTKAGIQPEADAHIQHTVGSIIGSSSTSGDTARGLIDTWSPSLTAEQNTHLPLVAKTKDYLSPPPPDTGLGAYVWPTIRTVGAGLATEAATEIASQALGFNIPGIARTAIDTGVGAVTEAAYERAMGAVQRGGAPAITGLGADLANGLPYRALRGTGYGESLLAPQSGDQPQSAPPPPSQGAPTPGAAPQELSNMSDEDLKKQLATGDAAQSAAPQELSNMSDDELQRIVNGSAGHAPPPEGPQPHFAGGRVGRATGGSVHNARRHEYLVNRLLKAAKDAKRVTDKTTEPLLKVPDEHIVKALDVAQQAI